MGPYLAIDIGGTYIKSAFFGADQEMYGHRKVKTKENINHAIVEQVKQMVDHAAFEEAIEGVGISTAGIVDRDQGEIIYAGPTIPNYKGTALKKELTRSFGLPVTVENDVNAALLGEVWQGAGRGQNNLFCITLGTGIGGAYFDNHIVDGSHRQANAVGYMLYDKESKTNYEMRASTSALNDRIQQHYGEQTRAEEVFSQAKQGDMACLALIEDWAAEIAKGLAQIILVRDPSCMIIGGGVSAQGNFLLDIIQNQVASFLPEHFLKTEFKMAQLSNHAALYGAVYPFFQRGNSDVR